MNKPISYILELGLIYDKKNPEDYELGELTTAFDLIPYKMINESVINAAGSN